MRWILLLINAACLIVFYRNSESEISHYALILCSAKAKHKLHSLSPRCVTLVYNFIAMGIVSRVRRILIDGYGHFDFPLTERVWNRDATPRLLVSLFMFRVPRSLQVHSVNRCSSATLRSPKKEDRSWRVGICKVYMKNRDVEETVERRNEGSQKRGEREREKANAFQGKWMTVGIARNRQFKFASPLEKSER